MAVRKTLLQVSTTEQSVVDYAIHVLFERYQEFKGMGAYEICEEFAVSVEEIDRLHPLGGELGLGSLRVSISKKAELLELKEFVIFHELAHLFLHFTGVSFRESDQEYWSCESWCDNFAYAMLLARFDCDAVDREFAREFFEQGKEISDPRERNKHIALRLFAYCKGGAWADHPSEVPPLMRLAQKLSE